MRPVLSAYTRSDRGPRSGARSRSTALYCGVAVATLIASTASAQASDPGAATALDDIVVTAQKRSESLLTVPTPVSAISAEALERGSVTRLEDLAAKVPGLNLQSDRPGQTIIILRGVTTGSPTSSTVATYIDDVPFGSSTTQALAGWLSPDLDPSDLERVEVLRGPQGTLYGASSLGGLIKYVTTQPDLDTVSGRLSATATTVDHGGDGHGLRGMLNVPIVHDTLGLRVSAFSREDPGYISNPRSGHEEVNRSEVSGGRAALRWEPTDALSLTLSATIHDFDSDGSSEEDVVITNGRITPATGEREQIRYAAETFAVKDRLYSLSANYALGWADFVSVTSFSTMDQTATVDQTIGLGGALEAAFGIPNFGFSVGSDIDLEKVTQEFRLESPANDRLEWRAGLYYTNETVVRLQPSSAFSTQTGDPYPLPAPVFFANLDSEYTEYAGYGDLTFHLSPRLDLSAGVRYSENDQDYTSVIGGLASGPTTTTVASSSDDSTTFMVTPRYRITDDTMVYARVATGYRPGGPNGVPASQLAAGVPAVYGPDELTNYDIGYKASLLDHRLVLDLSAFYIDWEDIQLLTRFGSFTAAGNGGTARSQGFEATALAAPVEGLSITATLAYTDAELTEDAPGVSGFDGDRLPSVPKWQTGLSVDYDFTVSGSVTGFVGGGVHYVGDRVSPFTSGAPAGNERPVMPSYTTVDLRAGVTFDRYTLQVFAKNLGDERAFGNIGSEAASGFGAPYSASIIQPRTLGVTLTGRW